jgi:hypothetical protein
MHAMATAGLWLAAATALRELKERERQREELTQVRAAPNEPVATPEDDLPSAVGVHGTHSRDVRQTTSARFRHQSADEP